MEGLRREYQEQRGSREDDLFKQKEALEIRLKQYQHEHSLMSKEVVRVNKVLKDQENTMDELKVKNYKIIKRLEEKHDREHGMLQSTLDEQLG